MGMFDGNLRASPNWVLCKWVSGHNNIYDHEESHQLVKDDTNIIMLQIPKIRFH